MPAAAAVWVCPTCGHGSPERRDERAHLDAHRQLQGFFDEWEAGTARDPAGSWRPEGPLALVYALAVALALVASVALFASVNSSDGSLPRGASSGPVPGVLTPGADPVGITVPEPPAASPVPARPTAAPVARSAAPSAPDPATTRATSPPAPGAGSFPAVTGPAAAPPGDLGTPPADPAPRLLQACLLGICLTI